MATARRSNPIISALIRQYVYWSLPLGRPADGSATVVHYITPSRSLASFSQLSALLEQRYAVRFSACTLLTLFLAQLPGFQGKVSRRLSSAFAVDPHITTQRHDNHVLDLL